MIEPEGVIVSLVTSWTGFTYRPIQASEWFLLILAFILTTARILLHIRMRQKVLFLSDCMLVVAFLAALGLVICDTLTYQSGAMDSFTQNSVAIIKVCRAGEIPSPC